MSALVKEKNHKQRASRGCNKRAQHSLRVLILNKFGFFCDSCKISLLNDNLVEEPEEEDKQLKIKRLGPGQPEPAKPADADCKRRSIGESIYNVNG
jgi:hypothetical protein